MTPINLNDQLKGIDWYNYLRIWEKLSDDMKYVGTVIGIEEGYLAKGARGRLPQRTDAQRCILSVHLRFYTALVLNALIHEVPLVDVSKYYGLSRGQLQSLQNSASTFSGMVTIFCKKLCWHNLHLLLEQFQSRLAFGIERELCDLIRISLLNGIRAR